LFGLSEKVKCFSRSAKVKL